MVSVYKAGDVISQIDFERMSKYAIPGEFAKTTRAAKRATLRTLSENNQAIARMDYAMVQDKGLALELLALG